MFDIMQKEYHSQPFSDTITYTFTKTEKIDKYNIRYYIGEQRHWAQLWLDDRPIIIYGHLEPETLVIDSVENSAIYNDVKLFYQQFRKTPMSERNSFLLEHLEKNLNNPFSFEIGNIYLMQNSSDRIALTEMKKIFDRQGDKFSKYYDYGEVVGKLNLILNIDKINIDEYSFLNKSAQIGKLNLPKAKFYLLDFWFMECAPCRADHKKIKDNYALFHSKNVEIIGLSIDNGFKDWSQYLTNNSYSWTNYIIPKGSTLTDDLSINSYPSYVLLDEDFRYMGLYYNIEHFITTFLKK